MSRTRVEHPTLWQWLKGKRTQYVTMASSLDSTPIYEASPNQRCPWCTLGIPHTEHAHHIQMLKRDLFDKAFQGDEISRRKLEALEAAEKEFS